MMEKKQRLRKLQMLWNNNHRKQIFFEWNNLIQAHAHYRTYKQSHCMKLWKQLYQYHVAAAFERQKNIDLTVNTFKTWQQFTLITKQKQQKAN